MTTYPLVLLPPLKSMAEQTQAECDAEFASLVTGRRLDGIRTAQGLANVLIGAPIDGSARVPVLVMYHTDLTRAFRLEVDVAEAAAALSQ